MEVYDFDKTLYSGDSTLNFYLFCCLRNPLLLRHLPKQLFYLIKYCLGLGDKMDFKKAFYCFLKSIKDIDAKVTQFWKSHQKKINYLLLPEEKSNLLVISASPDFLLLPICQQLGIPHLIASLVDKHSGCCLGANCYGEEKVRRYQREFGNIPIISFYSDSLSDTPLAQLAEKSYIVDGLNIYPWDSYTPKKNWKTLFFTKEFFVFLLIGGMNAFNGVLFAGLLSLFLDANLAFIVGYIFSLSISYLLNSQFTFKEKLRFSKYIKFCISYIPNFIIQNLSVILFFNIGGLPKLLSYIIAALLGVPLTFLLIKLFAFEKHK